MLRLQIQLPLNVSRSLEEALREHVETNASEYQTEIRLENSHACGGEYPIDSQPVDIMIGFMPELAMQTDEYLLEHIISSSGRFPMSKELQEQGFSDTRGCFHVFGIVPFIMFYNPDYTEEAELPRTWSEILNPQWKGRIMMPGKEHMASRVIRAFLKHDNLEKAQAIDENITCSGMPPNVIEAVKNGEFALGITNITFGKISESQKIKMIWPEDGLLCMPQIMVWKKGIDESLLKLGDFMLASTVQTLLAQQSFVPTAPGNEIPKIIRANQVGLKWTGWDEFRQAMRNSEI